MKNIFNITKLNTGRNASIRKFTSIIFSVAIIAGFMFSTPGSSVKEALVRDQIAEIKAANLASTSNIAYAQEGDMADPNWDDTNTDDNTPTTPICCSLGETPNDGEYCSDSACMSMCCAMGSNPGPGYKCDDSLCTETTCRDDNTCPTTSVCCDEYAQNYVNPEEQQYPEDYTCDGNCSYYNICCDMTALNHNTESECADFHNRHDQSTCIPPPTYCCDGNWSNYTPPSGRVDPHNCEYNEPTCVCVDGGDGSQCGGGDGGTGTSTPSCLTTTTFSTLKSGVTISGNAAMYTAPVACDIMTDPSCDPTAPPACITNPGDQAALAGAAAAAATPSTPLNVPQSLGAFSTYTVTSKDWCQNIPGDQDPDTYNRDNDGFCCDSPQVIQGSGTDKSCTNPPPIPACGNATQTPTDTAPASDLCSNGTPGNVIEGADSYNWTCDISPESTSCSVTRTCNGQTCCTADDCGISDKCTNYAGEQDDAYLFTNNMYSDSTRYCWDNTIGACGTARLIPAPTGGPTTNLCTSPSMLNSSPTFNGSSGFWEWTCLDSSWTMITTPPACQASPCSGNQCTTATSGLIRNFTAQPAIVSASDKFCSLSWESTVDENTDADVSDVCTINGGSSLNGNTIYDDNPISSGLTVQPGSYALTCTDSENNSQTKSVKCIVKPDFKEI